MAVNPQKPWTFEALKLDDVLDDLSDLYEKMHFNSFLGRWTTNLWFSSACYKQLFFQSRPIPEEESKDTQETLQINEAVELRFTKFLAHYSNITHVGVRLVRFEAYDTEDMTNPFCPPCAVSLHSSLTSKHLVMSLDSLVLICLNALFPLLLKDNYN